MLKLRTISELEPEALILLITLALMMAFNYTAVVCYCLEPIFAWFDKDLDKNEFKELPKRGKQCHKKLKKVNLPT